MTYYYLLFTPITNVILKSQLMLSQNSCVRNNSSNASINIQ